MTHLELQSNDPNEAFEYKYVISPRNVTHLVSEWHVYQESNFSKIGRKGPVFERSSLKATLKLYCNIHMWGARASQMKETSVCNNCLRSFRTRWANDRP